MTEREKALVEAVRAACVNTAGRVGGAWASTAEAANQAQSVCNALQALDLSTVADSLPSPWVPIAEWDRKPGVYAILVAIARNGELHYHYNPGGTFVQGAGDSDRRIPHGTTHLMLLPPVPEATDPTA